MKIILESAEVAETEVIIRGDVASPEVAGILQQLGKKNIGKLFLYLEDEQFIVDAGEIVFLETSGSRVSVYTQNQIYESKLKLYELKEMLGASPFAQINKSVIVNIDCIKSIQAEFSGNYRVKLKYRREVLTISRKYFKEFKDRF